MKQHGFLSIAMIATLFTAPALAQRDDCGPRPNLRSNDIYCGDFVESNGNELLCGACTTEQCINVQNDSIAPTGATGPLNYGVCSSTPNMWCNDGFPCDGVSLCTNINPNTGMGHCCLPRPCQSTDCGQFSDGCGGTESCSQAPGCMPITLQFPDEVTVGDSYPVIITNLFPSANFDIWFTSPNGGQIEAGQDGSYRALWNGTYNGNWTIEPQTFGVSGMWQVQIVDGYVTRWGFDHSNVVSFYVD